MDLILAAAGACGYGLASVLQASAAGRARGTLATLAAPLYLAGLVLDLLAWLASLAALRGLPVYEVQAVLAASLAVTAVTARLVLDHRLRRIDRVAIAVTMAALVTIALAAGPQVPVSVSRADRWALAATVIPVAAAGWWAARRRSAAAAGCLAGLAFGGAAVCARAVQLPARPQADLIHALAVAGADPVGWSLAGFGITGMVLYANALEHGDAGRVTALLWITEVVAPASVGVLLLHDRVRPGWPPMMLGALAAAVLSAAVLACAPPAHTAPDGQRARGRVPART